MKIIVTADTHMPRMAKKLPEKMLEELRNCDAIIHGGDWCTLSLYKQLSAFAPTFGVAGNNDGPELQAKFGRRKILRFDQCRIGLIHGHGALKRSSTEAHAVEAFKHEKLDALIYGHSHIPVLKNLNGVILFNPGSPTDKRKQPRYSFGVFHIDGKRLTARHVFYDRKF